jgi:hypothetical protein
MRLEQLVSVRRRRWIVTTLAAATALYTWVSVNRLSDLVDVQQLDDDDVGRHSLLELAEQNIASHLHLPQHGGHGERRQARGVGRHAPGAPQAGGP